MEQSESLKLQEFLESDRQWPRSLRIDHAKYQIELARKITDQEQIKFWESVFEANAGDDD